MSDEKIEKKKPLHKKAWFWVVVLILMVLGAAYSAQAKKELDAKRGLTFLDQPQEIVEVIER